VLLEGSERQTSCMIDMSLPFKCWNFSVLKYTGANSTGEGLNIYIYIYIYIWDNI
jgi:hypothetical protein